LARRSPGQIISFGKDKDGKTIDYGSTVEEGTVLAQMDDSVYAADVALAKAQLEQDKAGEVSATANLEQAKAKAVQRMRIGRGRRSLVRRERLRRRRPIRFKAGYDIGKANVNVAEASLTQSKATSVKSEATLNKAQRNLDFCTIKSPVKGVIIDRRVNIGQTVCLESERAQPLPYRERSNQDANLGRRERSRCRAHHSGSSRYVHL